MRRDEAALIRLAESVADGRDVDWASVASSARAEDQALVSQLRIVAGIATLHRSFHEAGSMGSARSGPARQGEIDRWGHFAILEPVGAGSFGEVYRAWDMQLKREVALKLLRAGGAELEKLADRVLREARLLARVKHSSVVQVFGADSHDGRVGFWMEFIRGTALEELLRKHGPFGPREAMLIGLDVCGALAAVHRAGLVHRDVKAQNVMREEGGRIVLMDFGTGEEMRSGAAVGSKAGTPLYLAPEIFRSEPATARSDVYSAGVLLYHLVTGSYPVVGGSLDDLGRAHERQVATRLRDARGDLPEGFVRVVERALAPAPEHRFESAGAMEAALADALGVGAQPRATTAPSSAREATPGPQAGVRRRHVAIAGVAAATILSAILLATLGLPVRDRREGTGGGVPSIRSVAVLPLENVSGDPSQDYFADSLTDELIATLGRIGALKVTSRTSVMQFRRQHRSLPQVARALNVDVVLEGSVLLLPAAERHKGVRVRINAQLIDAGNDAQIWAGRFERHLSDVLALQGEVAQAVAEEVRVRLTPDERRRLTASGTHRPEAQEAYLQGRYFLNRDNPQSLRTSLTYLTRAVHLDPDYARAHAALARCYVLLEVYGALPRGEAYRLGLAAAEQAVRLDPGLAEAYAHLADIRLYYEWDWSRAQEAYRRAVALNPSYSFARTQYARHVAARGRLQEALEEARRAEEIDPLSAETRSTVGLVLYYSRRYDEAIEHHRNALALDPKSAQIHLSLGRTYAAKGAFAQALQELEQAVALSGEAPGPLAELGRTYAAMGRQKEALVILRRLRDRSPAIDSYSSSLWLGNIYAALGETNRAFDMFNEAIDERAPQILWANVDPRLDSVRRDPRFPGLIRRLGLPD